MCISFTDIEKAKEDPLKYLNCLKVIEKAGLYGYVEPQSKEFIVDGFENLMIYLQSNDWVAYKLDWLLSCDSTSVLQNLLGNDRVEKLKQFVIINS